MRVHRLIEASRRFRDLALVSLLITRYLLPPLTDNDFYMAIAFLIISLGLEFIHAVKEHNEVSIP